MTKSILCVDFDGVIHSYTSGWQGAGVVSDPPVSYAFDFLYAAICTFDVQIFSARSHQDGGIDAMEDWFAKWDQIYHTQLRMHNQPIPRTSLLLNLSFPTHKPSAFITLDDRAVTFNGNFPTVEELQAFKPWWKK